MKEMYEKSIKELYMNKLPYPEHLARGYPPGVTPDRRRIEKCSDPKLWYANKIGQVITVHYFATFGAWDTEGRWLWYYDLSAPVKKKNTKKYIFNLLIYRILIPVFIFLIVLFFVLKYIK